MIDYKERIKPGDLIAITNGRGWMRAGVLDYFFRNSVALVPLKFDNPNLVWTFRSKYLDQRLFKITLEDLDDTEREHYLKYLATHGGRP